MDMLSLINGNAGQTQKTELEYVACAASPVVNGDVTLTIAENALHVVSCMDAAHIPFAEINAIALKDYIIILETDDADYLFSKMGRWGRPFYDALCDAYNKAALRALFIKGTPLLTAKGDYRYRENGSKTGGVASAFVYGNGVVTLPPNVEARRVPLCFVSDIVKSGFELTLKLDTGESYTYARLGYDTQPFADAIETQMRALREQTLAAVKDIDPSLSTAHAAHIAKLMSLGAAASFGRIAAVAPSFADVLVTRISSTRAAQSFQAFQELCGLAQIQVGFRNNEPAAGNAENMPAAIRGLLDGSANEPNSLLASMQNALAETAVADSPTDPYLLWLIAPSANGRYAAVEFAAADTATFIYHTDGDFNGFARQLNRALEAIDFKREVIWLSDTELQKPAYTDYRMAVKRNKALQYVRACFVGRAIHSSAGTWKKTLLSYFDRS